MDKVFKNGRQPLKNLKELKAVFHKFYMVHS